MARSRRFTRTTGSRCCRHASVMDRRPGIAMAEGTDGPLSRFIPARAPGFDSVSEGSGFELVWGFSCQVVVLGFSQFFVRSGKAVLHPVACDQVRGARGRGQGTETVAQLGGLPLSVACVSQRLDA